LLQVITTYGYVGFAGLVFIAALGVPLPLILLLLAVGAWSGVAGGPSLPALMVIATSAAVAGDCTDYAVGRMGATLLRKRLLWLQRRLRARAPAGALDVLWRRQGIAVFVTRCALTVLSVPVSLLAGASRMRFARFLAWEAAGKGLFVVVWLTLGHLFAGSLMTLGPLPTLAAAIAVVSLLALALWEARRWLARQAPPSAAPCPDEPSRPLVPLR
jgi:membrane-associated protein